MKYLTYFITLMIINLSQSQNVPYDKSNLESSFKNMQNNIINCILRDSKISENLRKYATEFSNSSNVTFNLGQFMNEESDFNIIKKCRREALLLVTNKSSRNNQRGPAHPINNIHPINN